MRTVRSFSNERNESRHYDNKLKTVFKYQVREAVIYGLFSILVNMIDNLLVTVTLLYGGFLVINKDLSPGNLISYMFYWIALGECLNEIGDVYSGMMQAVGAAEKVFRIIYRVPKIDHHSGDYAPAKVAGHVEFRDVTFSYPTRKDAQALKDISFIIQPGKTVALVGPSGGKFVYQQHSQKTYLQIYIYRWEIYLHKSVTEILRTTKGRNSFRR